MSRRAPSHSARSRDSGIFGAVRTGYRHRTAVVIGLIGVLMTASVSGWLWSNERRRAAGTLDSRGEVMIDSISDAFGDVARRMMAVDALVESSEDVTREEFRRFIDHMGLVPGLGGIGYMPIVEADQLGSFVEKMRETIPDYTPFELDGSGQRVPVGVRPEYFPLQWFEPTEAFGRPHGFDSSSEINRWEALQHSRKTLGVGVTSFLQLVSETEADGFLMYWPGKDPATDEVNGFTVAPMDLSELLDSHLAAALLNQVAWDVRDITDGALSQPEIEGSWVGNLDIGGRRWEIAVTPEPGSDMVPNPVGSLVVLLVGLLATALATGGFYMYRQRAAARHDLRVLQEITRAKDQFLATVSHELRTPLTAVVGFAELLRESHSELSDADRLSMISSVADEAADLSQIIEDLLVAARYELDLLVVTRIPVSIEAQIARVLEAAGTEIAARVEVTGGSSGPHRAMGDPGRVRQILRNLISNSDRYGGDRIQVRFGAADGLVKIQVADDGAGLPADEWERIFEVYYSAHPGSSQPAALGIGLNVARHLARLMGGDLTYRRQDGWSVFELGLPKVMETTGRHVPSGTGFADAKL
ncbi:MAG: CHASE domain-containing protein [Acidimicrobiia bacterium]